jgi:hypothetical protein
MRLKIAVVGPMPSASVSTTTAAKPRCRLNTLRLSHRSRSIGLPVSSVFARAGQGIVRVWAVPQRERSTQTVCGEEMLCNLVESFRFILVHLHDHASDAIVKIR